MVLCIDTCKKTACTYSPEKLVFIKRRCNRSFYNFYIECFSFPNKKLISSIFIYIEPRDVICSYLYVSKTWKQVLLNSQIWENYECKYGILSRITINPKRILSERRSKGNVYVGKYLCDYSKNKNSYENVVVRVVDLEMTNGGKDDGVPTSSLREMSNLIKLQHPNIVKYYGSQILNKCLFIVTEFISYNLTDFINLKHEELLKGNPSINLVRNEFIQIITDLIKAITYIHDKKVFHTNLKPENILIETESQIINNILCHKYKLLKIGDFSMGRLTGLESYSPEEPKERCPSFRECRRLFYKSPEVMLRCNTYDENIDFWSVGVVFYEMVCQEALFNAFNEISLIWEIFKLTGFPDHSILPSIPNKIYQQWKSIVLHNDGIRIEDILSSIKSRQNNTNLTKKYKQSGQLEPFEKLVKFGRIMGPESLKLFMNLINIVPLKRIGGVMNLKEMCHNFKHSNSTIQSFDFNFKLDIYKLIVNWYFNVATSFNLSSLSVHIAVEHLIKVLNKWQSIELNQLVPIFICCLKISHRLNEVSHEYYKCDNYSEYSEIASVSKEINKIMNTNYSNSDKINKINISQLAYFEKTVLNVINFDISLDSLHYIVSDFGKIMEIESKSHCFRYASLLSNLCLYDLNLINFEHVLKAEIIWMISIYKYMVKECVFPNNLEPEKESEELRIEKEYRCIKIIMRNFLESGSCYKCLDIWNLIKCVGIIEDIANIKCKKMMINPEQNAVFIFSKIEFDIGEMVDIPVKFIKMFIDKSVYSQLNGIAVDILCRNLAQCNSKN